MRWFAGSREQRRPSDHLHSNPTRSISSQISIGVGALLVCLPALATGQRLAGTVRDPAGQPVASAVVSLIAPGGASVSRTVTGRDGTFILPVDAAARTITVIRIGFLPAALPLPDSAHTTRAAIAVTLQTIPHVLEPIVVVDASCPRNSSTGDARALWEQARAGFLASVVAREAAPPDADLLHYFRLFGTNSQVLRTTVDAIHSTSTRPILAARSPAMFATAGYVADSSTGRQYFGPDADVLVVAGFSHTHCFSLEKRDRGLDGMV